MASASALRRTLGCLLGALLAAVLWSGAASAQIYDMSKLRRGAVLEVVYLGTPDCPYCQHWEARARGELLASPLAQSFRFHEVIGRTLREPITAAHYPEDLQWLAKLMGPSRGVPRFLLLGDRTLLASVYGTNAYETQFLPVLREAVARRNAGS
ncbi:MAG: hypothetical protein IPK29_03345 [Betaproteobacteria bacterium]|nr:hypothetical protein [Betaproteobacteria bacterium]